jgi:hypothetical protein
VGYFWHTPAAVAPKRAPLASRSYALPHLEPTVMRRLVPWKHHLITNEAATSLGGIPEAEQWLLADFRRLSPLGGRRSATTRRSQTDAWAACSLRPGKRHGVIDVHHCPDRHPARTWVTALEIEVLHKKIDELRAQEVQCLSSPKRSDAGAGNVRSGTRPGGARSAGRVGTAKPYGVRLPKLWPEAIFISGNMEFKRAATLRSPDRAIFVEYAGRTPLTSSH